MSKLTEFAIEGYAIKLFEQFGHNYDYAPAFTLEGDKLERRYYSDGLEVRAGALSTGFSRFMACLNRRK